MKNVGVVDIMSSKMTTYEQLDDDVFDYSMRKR